MIHRFSIKELVCRILYKLVGHEYGCCSKIKNCKRCCYELKQIEVKAMTVKELYDWAIKHDAENLNIRVAYYDYDGDLIGQDAMPLVLQEEYKYGPDDELILVGTSVLI